MSKRIDGTGAERGQALIEFALGSVVLFLLLAGAIDFGQLYSQRLELDNAVRVGARWAAKHPTAWTATANPADNTIQGQIIYAGDTRNIPNNDASISIRYRKYDKVTKVFTQCGHYKAAAVSGFVPDNGYTKINCVVPGTFITVIVNYNYPVLTPFFQSLFGTTILVQSQSTFLEEV